MVPMMPTYGRVSSSTKGHGEMQMADAMEKRNLSQSSPACCCRKT